MLLLVPDLLRPAKAGLNSLVIRRRTGTSPSHTPRPLTDVSCLQPNRRTSRQKHQPLFHGSTSSFMFPSVLLWPASGNPLPQSILVWNSGEAVNPTTILEEGHEQAPTRDQEQAAAWPCCSVTVGYLFWEKVSVGTEPTLLGKGPNQQPLVPLRSQILGGWPPRRSISH